jgi:hypothetical protein
MGMEGVHHLCQTHFPNAKRSRGSRPRMRKSKETKLCARNGQEKNGYYCRCKKERAASIRDGSHLANYHVYIY